MTRWLARFQQRCDTIAKWLLVIEFAAFPIFLGLANSVMVLIVAMWLLSGQYKQRWNAIARNPLTLPLCLLYLMIVLAAAYSPASWPEIFKHYGKYSKLLMCLVFMSLLADAKWCKRCWLAFAVSTIFILLSTYLNIWIDLPWSVTKNRGWGADHTVSGDYITQNIQVAFFVALCMAYAHYIQRNGQRTFAVLLTIAGALAVTQLSQGRTGVILLAVVSVVCVWCLFGSRRSVFRKIVTSAFALCVVIAVTTSSPLMKSRLVTAYTDVKTMQTDPTTSVGIRAYRIEQSIPLVIANPIFGSGTASYHKEICKVLVRDNKCEVFSGVHPDNQYLFFLIDLGAVGLALYLWLIAVPFIQSRQLILSAQAVYIAMGLMLFLNSFVSSSLWTARQNHFFVFMLALLAMSAVHLKQPSVSNAG